MISYQLYIDGAWTGSDGDSVLTVLNPATEEAIGTVPEGTVADIDRAVVLVEQHVMLALEIADTAMVLTHGDVALQGEAKALTADESLIERAYLGGSTDA